MGANYAQKQAIDRAGTPYHTTNVPPPASAIARYLSENATVSSVITVTPDTTAIEISTGGTQTIMRWVATTDTQGSVIGVAGATANFDHVIPSNSRLRLIIPIDTTASYPPNNSMVGANIANQLYRRFAWKTQGIASVYGSEFQ